MKKMLILSSLALIILINCKKNSNNSTLIFEDNLTEEQNEFIESISIPTPELTKLLRYNGSSFARVSGINDNPKEVLIDSILRYGHALCRQRLYTTPNGNYPAGQTEYQLAQKGLAYVYGSRQIDSSQNPTQGSELYRKYQGVGTDCSGFLAILFYNAGLTGITTNISSANFESRLNTELSKSELFKDIKVINKGYLLPDSIQTGDIILWYNPEKELNHIGLIAETTSKDTILVLQSNGNKNNTDPEKVKSNFTSLNRGVHTFNYKTMIKPQSKNYWSKEYKILRLTLKNKELVIDSKASWVNTGVRIRKNSKISITQSSGGWSVDKNNYPNVSADGHTNEASTLLSGVYSLKTFSGAYFGTLLGKIGNNIFKIGANFNGTIPYEGTLYLQINDEAKADNGGEVTIKITEN